MKKLLALVLAGAMALSMVACSGGNDKGGADEGAEKLKVNLLCSQLGDKSFNDSADTALKALKDAGEIEYVVREFGNDNSVVEQELMEAAEAGYDIVMCNNLGYGKATEWLRNNAETYPDTWFFVYDEPTDTVDAANVILLAYRANESDYLAGVVAAKESETGVIGFVGGMENPVIHDFLVGYIQGAKSVNPDVKVLVAYTDSYTDAQKGNELGTTMLGQGADVIHGVAGTAGNGALEAAAKAGKLCIGVDADQYYTLKDGKPEVADRVITSALKEVGKSLVSLVKEVEAGTLVKEGDRVWFAGEGAYVGIAENENYDKLASDETKAAVDAAKAGLADGSITVKSAYDMTTDEINRMVADAQ